MAIGWKDWTVGCSLAFTAGVLAGGIYAANHHDLPVPTPVSSTSGQLPAADRSPARQSPAAGGQQGAAGVRPSTADAAGSGRGDQAQPHAATIPSQAASRPGAGGQQKAPGQQRPTSPAPVPTTPPAAAPTSPAGSTPPAATDPGTGESTDPAPPTDPTTPVDPTDPGGSDSAAPPAGDVNV